MKPIVIFGTSDFAEVSHYYLTKDAGRKIAAFCVDPAYLKEDKFLDIPVCDFETISTVFPPADYEMFIAIAYSKLNRARADKFFEARDKGYSLASFVSSKLSSLEPVHVGENCFVLEDNTIQPFTQIGENTIIWSGNHIGHHSKIGSHCFISSHVCISGKVSIADYCFLGVNSSVREGVSIGEGCLIGAGSLIMSDTLPNQLFAEKATPPRSIPADSVEF